MRRGVTRSRYAQEHILLGAAVFKRAWLLKLGVEELHNLQIVRQIFTAMYRHVLGSWANA